MAKRMFPAYHIDELRKFAAEGITPLRSAEKLAMIKAEIAARESGESQVTVTPQIKGAIS